MYEKAELRLETNLQTKAQRCTSTAQGGTGVGAVGAVGGENQRVGAPAAGASGRAVSATKGPPRADKVSWTWHMDVMRGSDKKGGRRTDGRCRSRGNEGRQF